jgi:hypothetical protein
MMVLPHANSSAPSSRLARDPDGSRQPAAVLEPLSAAWGEGRSREEARPAAGRRRGRRVRADAAGPSMAT